MLTLDRHAVQMPLIAITQLLSPCNWLRVVNAHSLVGGLGVPSLVRGRPYIVDWFVSISCA